MRASSPRSSRPRSEPLISFSARPSKHTVPVSGRSIPAANRSSVDLPERRAPYRPTNTPASTSKDTPSRTVISRPPSGKRLPTFANESSGVMAPVTLSLPRPHALVDAPSRLRGPVDVGLQLPPDRVARAVHHQRGPGAHCTGGGRHQLGQPQALALVVSQCRHQPWAVLVARDHELCVQTQPH